MTRIIEESELARLLAEAREPKWQPIETAPRDGTRILVKADSTVVAGWEFIHNADTFGWAVCNDAWVNDNMATHWMPLPEAPKGLKMKSEQRSVLSRDMQIAEAVRDALCDELGTAMDCIRVWSAWQVGTMSEDDFALLVNDDSRITDLVNAVVEAIASVPAPEPIAYLIERHVFRASQDGQDAEGLDWLEVAEIGDAGSFPVYAAPPAASSGANEVATINRQLLEASKLYMDGQAGSHGLLRQAIVAAEKEVGKC